MKHRGTKILAMLLTLAMVVGLMPGMSAYAASTTVTWNASDIVPEHPWDDSFTKDGITITAASCDFEQLTFEGGGTFTTTLGNFTKIEISADYTGDVSGTGWSNDGWQSATWTGDAASVSFSGDIWGGGMTCDGGNLTIKFTIAELAHTHSFTYSASGAAITATCTAGCPDGYNTSGITLTISAPTNLVCDGNPKTATISGYPSTAPAGLAAAPTSISYNPGGTAPTTPGTYTASFTWGGATASVSFTLTANAYAVTLSGGANATTSGGATTQSVTAGQAMTTVTYTANSGYTFPAFSNSTTNGVTLTRVSDTVVTVSGTPTADVSITVPDATVIPTYTVSFASGGGNGTMAPVSVAAGGIYPLPACGFTPLAGQQFRAWSYNGQEYAVGTQFIINNDATFTAVWEDIPVTTYTVTVHPGANGAAGVSQNVAAPGTTITVNPVPFNGYEVASITWSTDGGVTRNDITDTASFVMPAANVDVYVAFRPAGGGGGGGGSWGSWGDNDGGYYVPQRAYRLILAPTENGSAMLVVSNGQTVTEMNVYPTSYVQVYATPAPGYTLDKIIWSLIDSSASYDITQTAAFTMPAMDVVVYVTFKPLGS